MTVARDPSSVAKTISGIFARNGAGLKTIVGAYGRDASNVLRALIGGGSFSVSLSPETLYRYGYNAGPTQFTTPGPATVTATGGVPPYTVSWQFSDVDWSAVSPLSLSSVLRSPFLYPGESSTVTVTVEVEDADGTVLTTNSIGAYAENVYGS